MEKQETNSKMPHLNLIIPIITLSTKTQNVYYIKKQHLTIFYLQEMLFKYKDTHWIKHRYGKIYTIKMAKKAGEVIFISEEVVFKTRSIARDEKGQYVKIKKVDSSGGIIILNMHAPNKKP